MPGNNLSKISQTVTHFLNGTVTQLDNLIKFVKRKSKLSAQAFAMTLVVGCLSDPAISLERLCRLLKERGVKISSQGLHQRFTPEATTLMEALWQESLKQFKTEKCPVIDLLKSFSTVSLADSSYLPLPENLKDLYPGYGGAGSAAGVKVQVLLDYVQGQVNHGKITIGCRNDQSYEDHLSELKKGGLYLQDLGYFKLQTFRKIQEAGAYFISRYLNPTHLRDENNEPLNLQQALQKAGLLFTKWVWLGEKNPIRVRLIAQRLPEKEVQKRIRKLKRNGVKKGRTPSAQSLALAQWSIYVTNILESTLNDKQVHLVYALRWQIELFFKLCKSQAGIDIISGKKSDRVLCEIYAKLICVVILLYLCFPMRWQDNQELSFYKAYQLWRFSAADFMRALKSPYRLMIFLKTFFMDLKAFALKDKYRKKRRLAYQTLMDSTAQEALA